MYKQIKRSNICLNKGFTLAEVLITLGILGVIAAAIIPTVNKSVPDANKVMFKKAYNTLEKALDSLINDDFLYPSDQTAQISTTGIYIPDGFYYTTDATAEAGTYNKFCFYLAQKLDLIGDSQTCPATGKSGLFNFGTTTDGVSWYIYNSSTTDSSNFPTSKTDDTAYATKIIFDVNGQSKTPNCSLDTAFNTYASSLGSYKTTCTDPDLFIIGVRYDGKTEIGSGASTDTNAQNILKAPLTNIK